jgi:gamma-glutamylputrescine oxidase
MDLSFWEQNSYFREIDALVIGSGIVGLNTARALKERNPKWKILVTDRGFLPYGASTRNAGFTCFGSISELMDDLNGMSEAEVFAIVQRRWEGLKRLRSILGDDEIDYEGLGGFEIFTTEDELRYENCKEQLGYFNQNLARISGDKEIYTSADEKISGFGFRGVKHLIHNRGEGQIDTGKMMKALLRYVRALDIEVMNGIEIKGWEEHGDGMLVHTGLGFSFKAQRVVVTTNAFARELIPEIAVEPGRAQVLITAPINDLKIKGAFHYDAGYYYFRNVGNRVLFGGGRNLDFQTEKTMAFGLTPIVQNRLEELLSSMILPGIEVQIEQRWSGIMGLGREKTTIIRKISEHLFCAVRMGGMGIAIGTLVGEEAAELMCD